ncbi:hypothetical protein L596_011018 [Steinernema carpocapsae]|uniref:Uncharacterized protein n=1 Tax=Steinernema carpocapsae TaxID=34508 RepID=A0A4U5NTG6_STECR|nr:hypothetical protein L596_011018 [Steinernema carpocapsae]
MKLRDSLVNMLGDFVQMNKNPEFRSKTDVSAPSSSPSGFNGNRRHSLNITVGAQGPPESLIHHRHSICPALMRNPNPIPDNLDSKSLDGRQESAPHSNRRQSEPAIKSAELHSKIKRLRNQSSLCSVDSDEENDSDGGASEVSVERRSYHSDNGTFSSGFSADKVLNV